MSIEAIQHGCLGVGEALTGHRAAILNKSGKSLRSVEANCKMKKTEVNTSINKLRYIHWSKETVSQKLNSNYKQFKMKKTEEYSSIDFCFKL
jgi:hypothetical protein